MKRKEPNKKKTEKKPDIFRIHFEEPKLELTPKKIKAIETILDDPMLRYKDSASLKALIDGYKAGKEDKGGKK